LPQVYARDEAEHAEWLSAVEEAVLAAKESAGVSTDPAALHVAPILAQTSDSNDCGECSSRLSVVARCGIALSLTHHTHTTMVTAICQQPFTLFTRKHHCMSCGDVVCDKCSPSRYGRTD